MVLVVEVVVVELSFEVETSISMSGRNLLAFASSDVESGRFPVLCRMTDVTVSIKMSTRIENTQ